MKTVNAKAFCRAVICKEEMIIEVYRAVPISAVEIIRLAMNVDKEITDFGYKVQIPKNEYLDSEEELKRDLEFLDSLWLSEADYDFALISGLEQDEENITFEISEKFYELYENEKKGLYREVALFSGTSRKQVAQDVNKFVSEKGCEVVDIKYHTTPLKHDLIHNVLIEYKGRL